MSNNMPSKAVDPRPSLPGLSRASARHNQLISIVVLRPSVLTDSASPCVNPKSRAFASGSLSAVGISTPIRRMRRGHVLFSNAEVSITLNEQVATTATCTVGQECTVTDGIQVVAVHVALTNADIAGRIVSGDFFLGEAQAGN
jgi:hypothetical protein